MAKISIITPCFNAEKFIGRTIESVLAQTFADWEMIVIDDGSTDSTADIAGRFAAIDPRVRLVRHENGGVCRARNSGFAAASPERAYLVFLDHDDCLKPGMLARMASYLDENPAVAIAHCALQIIDEQGRPAQDTRDFLRYAFDGTRLAQVPADQPETPFEAIFWNCPILPSACMIRRSVYEKTPGWDESFGQGNEDVDLFLHICLIAPIHFVPEALVQYRIHAGQASRRTIQQQSQQMRLYRKWLAKNGPAGERAGWVLATWRIYEGRLVPQLWLRRASMRLRQGNLLEGFKCLLRAVKHAWLARYMLGKAGREAMQAP